MMTEFWYVLVYAIIFFSCGFLAWFWSVTAWRRAKAIDGSWRTLWSDRYWLYTLCFAMTQTGLLMLAAGRSLENALYGIRPVLYFGESTAISALITVGLFFLLGAQVATVRVAALEIPPAFSAWVMGAAAVLGFAWTVLVL